MGSSGGNTDRWFKPGAKSFEGPQHSASLSTKVILSSPEGRGGGWHLAESQAESRGLSSGECIQDSIWRVTSAQGRSHKVGAQSTQCKDGNSVGDACHALSRPVMNKGIVILFIDSFIFY